MTLTDKVAGHQAARKVGDMRVTGKVLRISKRYKIIEFPYSINPQVPPL